MSDSLKQLQEKLVAKRAQLREVFEPKKAGDDGEMLNDFASADATWLGADVIALKGSDKSRRVAEIVNKSMLELDDMQDEYATLQAAEDAAKAFEKDDKTPVKRQPHPEGKKAEYKSIGQQVTEHPAFKQWRAGNYSEPIELPDVGLAEIKTLFQTTAGWTPESVRTGFVAEAVTRPLQIIDIMPTGRTGSAQVVYMREDTRTHAAAEKGEGLTYAESEFVLTEATSTVRKVTDSVPVTDEQLEDVPMAESYLEGRLMFGVMQRLDQQVISGDGTPPNIDGILAAGIQTQVKGADPVPDAIFKAMTKVRVTGRAMPTHVALHPNDWQPIRLLRTADGIYIWGNPSEAGPERIWGLPVIQNESLTEDAGLVGSFQPAWIQLVERRGVTIEMGFVGNDFKDGKKTLRASGRWALPIYRPAAFCSVTGI